MLRTSHLDLDVRLSVHPAPENLNLSDFCSCGDSGDSFYGLLTGFGIPSYRGSHRCDVTLRFLHQEALIRSIRMNGLVF